MKEINSNLQEKCGIYIITNLENGNRYIGSAYDVYDRLHVHISELNRQKGHNAHLQAAWNKYGKECFEYGILEFCERSIRFIREQYYIDTLHPEYNITQEVVANFGHEVSNETKTKISETLKRRYAAKEIETYKQEHNWLHCYLYDAISFKYLGEFNNTADCARAINYAHGGNAAIFETFIFGKYVVSREKFSCLSDLMNYIFKNFRKMKLSPIWGQRYLVVKDKNGKITYYESIAECSRKIGPSASIIMKHLDATENNPYISSKFPEYKIYFIKEYQDLPYDATSIPEGKIEKSTKNGELCDENTVVTEETKEFSAPYSVETETDLSE